MQHPAEVSRRDLSIYLCYLLNIDKFHRNSKIFVFSQLPEENL